MQVEYFKPINLKLESVLDSGYEISWEIAATGVSLLSELPADAVFVVYGRGAVSGVTGIITTVAISVDRDGHGNVAIPTGISEVYITARIDGVESTQSTSLAIVSTNILPNTASVAVGRDEDGFARSLSVTSDGVLRVTGATVNNYGGDASAANQTTLISKQDSTITAINAVKTSTDAVVSGLATVGLEANTVNALQNVTVSNFPSNYPDADALNAINTLNTNVAKDATLTQIRDNTDHALKSTDLALTMGVLDTRITNTPSDYPDAAVLAELQGQYIILNSVVTNTSTALTKQDTIISINETAKNTLNDISNKTDSIITNTAGIAVSNATIQSTTANIEALINTTNALITANNTNQAELLKTTDLALNTGVLSVTETNPITDFPDIAAHAKLDTINDSVLALAAGQTITFGESLPAGTNNIGHVNVDTLPLPTNAATETSLVALYTKVSGAANSLTAISSELSTALVTLSKIEENTKDTSQVIICDEVLTVIGSVDFRPEASAADPTEMSAYRSYIVQLFSYSESGNFSIFKETAIDNNVYYHNLAAYNNASLFATSVVELNFDLIKNIMIRISGEGSFRVRITGIK